MMSQFCALILLLTVSATIDCSSAQKSYYRRSYYGSVAPPATQRFTPSIGPLSYRGDLQSDESKRRDVSKKYAKKPPYRNYGSVEEDDYSSERYTSGEYSSESQAYNSRENDSREYTIGTQIRVQHPISAPKKTTSVYPKHTKYITTGPYKPSTAYSDVNTSTEERLPSEPLPKRHAPKYTQQFYEPDPFHLVPPPKATAASSTNSYSVFEPEQDDYDILPPTRSKASYDRYKGVASKKQIEAFFEGQKKLLDDALKLQLLNDPKIQKYLKSKVKESPDGLDLDDFETYPPSITPPFRNNFNEQPPFKPNKARRRPSDLKRSPKTKHIPHGIVKPKRKYRSTALVISV